MKKLLLFLLAALMAYPCFAGSQSHRRFTYFSGIKLTDVNSKVDAGKEGYREGVDIYQFVPDIKNPAKTTFELVVYEESLNGDALSFANYAQMSTREKFEDLFARDLTERDHNGTYRKMYELNYINEKEGDLDAYVVKQYSFINEDETMDSLVFEIIRRKQIEDETVRVYNFTFKQNLKGNDITIRNRYNNVKTFSPAGYFNYMTKEYTKHWIDTANRLILPLFNK